MNWSIVYYTTWHTIWWSAFFKWCILPHPFFRHWVNVRAICSLEVDMSKFSFTSEQHIGRNIYYSATYMHYLRDYHARISLPIFTDFYLVKIQARISLPKRVKLCSATSASIYELINILQRSRVTYMISVTKLAFLSLFWP